MSQPSIRDSRRLPGVNLLHDGPGAVLDVACADGDGNRLVARWQDAARRVLDALGWTGSVTRIRRFPGGASLFLSAPIDCLYTATEINEWAWSVAIAAAGGASEPSLDAGVVELSARLAKEATPALLALQAAAKGRGVTFTTDHKATSVGGGTGSRVWTADDAHHPAAPVPDTVDWPAVHDIPMVLVTGSNGKTTTVRLLASVMKAWGRTPGLCSTDNIVIGADVVDRGDWSGPMGARAVLRDPRVEVALLETARGGILRRGLSVERADAAIVTNVAEDHFGEWGIFDLRGIAETKLVVGHVVPRLVINAEDHVLVETLDAERRAGRVRAEIGYFALDPSHPVVARHLASGGTAAMLDGSDLLFVYRRRATRVVPAADVPITLGGVARFNVANALGVILLASAIGVPKEAIAEGLRRFKGTPRDNPGRGHLYDFGGLKVLVDFAHNPHGMRALVETARAMPAQRRLVILGQAGDRDDESIRGLARETWLWNPDRIILKEMAIYLRGRQPGEATGLLEDEFRKLGAPDSVFAHADSELAAVRAALLEAQPGDLVLLPVHAERDAVIQLMETLAARRWEPGRSLLS
jgi:UDP-N-acetylmuramyl tripeptide synthase